jgi:hypothetical protein
MFGNGEEALRNALIPEIFCREKKREPRGEKEKDRHYG